MTTTYQDGLGGQITILEPGDAHSPMHFRMIMPEGFGPPAPERSPGTARRLSRAARHARPRRNRRLARRFGCGGVLYVTGRSVSSARERRGR